MGELAENLSLSLALFKEIVSARFWSERGAFP